MIEVVGFDLAGLKKTIAKERRNQIGRIESLRFNVLPRLVGETQMKYEQTGYYRDDHLKITLPNLWFHMVKLEYGIWLPVSYEELRRFSDEINRRIKPHKRQSELVFDRIFFQTVKQIIGEERERILWHPMYNDPDGVDKDFEIAFFGIMEIKEAYLETQKIYI